MVRLATLLGDPSTFGSAAGDKRPLQPTTGRDGIVVVVSKDHTRCLPCEPATSMQNLMEQWPAFQPKLEALYARVNGGEGSPFSEAWAASPLPRAYQWLDGSAYVNHVELVRKARGAEMPASFWTDPLMYQGGSDTFLAPHEPITGQVEWGIDFEGELGVVTGDVPLGVSEDEAASALRNSHPTLSVFCHTTCFARPGDWTLSIVNAEFRTLSRRSRRRPPFGCWCSSTT